MKEAREDNGNIFGDWFQRHPLLQPPVLEVLFTKLSLKDLATSRLVCNEWCVESLPYWRTNATIKFENTEIFKNGNYFKGITPSLAHFLDFWDNECETRPFKKFHISWWDFGVGEVEQARFLSLVGEHVTSLTFSRCSFGGRGSTSCRKLLYQTFPNLQFLKLEDCDFSPSGSTCYAYDYENGEYAFPTEKILAYKEPTFGLHGLKSLNITGWTGSLPDSMMELLSHFHMITSLQMEPIHERHYRELLNAIKLIKAHDQSKLPIQHLNVGNFPFELDLREAAKRWEDLNLLQQLNLPLHRLRIWLDNRSNCELIHGEIIKEILQEHSSTLKSFSGTGNLQEICSQFPFGHQLENLEGVYISPDFCDNLNWLKYTPNLRRLYIRSMECQDNFLLSNNLFSNSSELEIGNWTLWSLKSLEFGLPISPGNMRKLTKWMPNVEDVEMKLDDEMFSILCENWTRQLKSLRDKGKELTDDGVTGRRMEAIEAGIGGSQPVPNIIHLESLTYFVSFSSKLTARSVYDGFLKMSSIKSVVIGPQIDSEAVAALDRHGLLSS